MEVLARNYVELQRTTGHTRVDPVLLVGSFNAGPAGVTRDRAHIRYRETRDYVKKVMYNKRVLRHMR
jgi:soluble lytic murein transglycosylase-like protein